MEREERTKKWFYSGSNYHANVSVKGSDQGAQPEVEHLLLFSFTPTLQIFFLLRVFTSEFESNKTVYYQIAPWQVNLTATLVNLFQYVAAL